MVELVIELKPFPLLLSHILIAAFDQSRDAILPVVINHWVFQ
jgi:hypothetical protein